MAEFSLTYPIPSKVAIHMPGPILSLLNEMDLRYAKVAIMAFASVYQSLFRLVCVYSDDRCSKLTKNPLQSIRCDAS